MENHFEEWMSTVTSSIVEINSRVRYLEEIVQGLQVRIDKLKIKAERAEIRKMLDNDMKRGD